MNWFCLFTYKLVYCRGDQYSCCIISGVDPASCWILWNSSGNRTCFSWFWGSVPDTRPPRRTKIKYFKYKYDGNYISWQIIFFFYYFEVDILMTLSFQLSSCMQSWVKMTVNDVSHWRCKCFAQNCEHFQLHWKLHFPNRFNE